MGTRVVTDSVHAAYTPGRSNTAPAAQRPSRASSTRRVVASASAPRRASQPSSVVEREHDPQLQGEPAIASAEVARTPESAGGDVVVTRAPIPAVDQPVPAPRTERRGASTVQSSILGAAAGAIIGATTGRSVKSAVIGAAAGGVLGGVVGRTTRPAGRYRS